MKIQKLYYSPDGEPTGGASAEELEKQKADKEKADAEQALKAAEEAKRKEEEEEKLLDKDKNKNIPLSDDEKKSVDSFLTKAEKGEELSKEEIELLKRAGYDIEVADNTAIWDEIHKVAGEKIDFELDSTEPLKPENIFKYADAYSKNRLTKFDESLREKAPKEYLALEMRLNGEDPSLLYAKNDNSLIAKEFKKEDAVIQKEVIRQAYKQRGLSDDDITDVIETFEEKGKLFENAKKAQEYLKELDDKSFKEVESKRQERLEKDEAIKNSFISKVNNIVKKGEIEGLVIPDKERRKFEEFVLSSVEYNEGKFFFVREVNQEELASQLKRQFIEYRKGDVNDLIEAGAKKKVVVKLKESLNNNSKKSSSEEHRFKQENKPKTLRDITNYEETKN